MMFCLSIAANFMWHEPTHIQPVKIRVRFRELCYSLQYAELIWSTIILAVYCMTSVTNIVNLTRYFVWKLYYTLI